MRKLSFVFFPILFVPFILYPQKKVEYNGYFEIGGKAEYNGIYIESYYKAKMEFEYKINNNTKVEVDIRGNSEDREIILYKASAEFELLENLELEIGDLKKRFGYEEWTSREKLPTIRRSIVNRYLEPLGYVNREPGIHIEWEKEDFLLSGGVHYNESHTASYVIKAVKKSLWSLDGAFANLQIIRTRDTEIPNATAFNAGIFDTIAGIASVLEFYYGLDPIESHYSALSGCDNDVYLGAARFITSKVFRFNGKILTGFEPVLSGALLVNNTDFMDVNKIQLLLGCNFYFNDSARLMINGDLITNNCLYNKSKRSLTDSNVMIQLQVRW
ncbi:porin [Melioribacter sp. OK-6-Me]|uniref:porin n=1 Tax=unclassified Melioribacter TaxID=2627329 RepID=UPI003EDA4B97